MFIINNNNNKKIPTTAPQPISPSTYNNTDHSSSQDPPPKRPSHQSTGPYQHPTLPQHLHNRLSTPAAADQWMLATSTHATIASATVNHLPLLT
jgi:hypothetical protein